MRSTLSPIFSPNAWVWKGSNVCLTMTSSHPILGDRRLLPPTTTHTPYLFSFFFFLSSSLIFWRSMVQCPWLCALRQRLKLPNAWTPSKTPATNCDGWFPIQSISSVVFRSPACSGGQIHGSLSLKMNVRIQNTSFIPLREITVFCCRWKAHKTITKFITVVLTVIASIHRYHSINTNISLTHAAIRLTNVTNCYFMLGTLLNALFRTLLFTFHFFVTRNMWKWWLAC